MMNFDERKKKNKNNTKKLKTKIFKILSIKYFKFIFSNQN